MSVLFWRFTRIPEQNRGQSRQFFRSRISDGKDISLRGHIIKAGDRLVSIDPVQILAPVGFSAWQRPTLSAQKKYLSCGLQVGKNRLTQRARVRRHHHGGVEAKAARDTQVRDVHFMSHPTSVCFEFPFTSILAAVQHLHRKGFSQVHSVFAATLFISGGGTTWLQHLARKQLRLSSLNLCASEESSVRRSPRMPLANSSPSFKLVNDLMSFLNCLAYGLATAVSRSSLCHSSVWILQDLIGALSLRATCSTIFCGHTMRHNLSSISSVSILSF